MTRRLKGALGIALFALLLVPFYSLNTRAQIDCLVDLCGFSGGQMTGLRDTWASKTGADTISGIKTHSSNVMP